jgi:competence protein ComEC
MTIMWRAKGQNRETIADPRFVTVRGARHPALLLAIFIAVGVVVADRVDFGPLTWVAVSLLSFFAVIAFLLIGRYRLWLVLAAGIFAASLGAWRMAVELTGRPSTLLGELFNSGEPGEVVGRLAGIPRETLTGWRAPVDVLSVQTRSGPIPLHACVLMTTRDPMAGFHHGDLIRLSARFEAPFVQRNPGGFDYAGHLFRQGIDALLRPTGPVTHLEGDGPPMSVMNLVEPVRGWIRGVFTAYLPKSARSLILGFLLGDTDQLAPGVIAAFRDSGTLHLLAVSGANVWLIVGLFFWPMRLLRVPRWPRTILLIALVVAFSFLTRNEPSVVRASLMVAFILVGRLVYRPVSILNAIGASAAVLLVASPSQLFRPGFQLSYAAVIAIALVTQRTASWAQALRPFGVRLVALTALSSVAATVATAPIVAWHFGTVSLASLVANLAMIPLAAAGLYTCLGVAALSVLSATAAGWMACPAAWILEFSSRLAGLFARMPGAQLSWPDPSLIWIVHLYAAGVLVLNWRHRYRWVRPASWYAAALVSALILGDLLHPRSPVITLAYLDTGTTRVAAYGHPNGSLVWLADDPGIDDRLKQWVTVPFARAQVGRATTERFLSWRCADSSDAVFERIAPAPSKYAAPVWRRYLSAMDSPTDSRRIWADRLAWGRDTVLCLRDYPTSPPGTTWLDTVLGRGHTIVLPTGTPDRLIRRLLDHFAPRQVVLFGAAARWRPADQRLEKWRLRYPRVRFYCTAVHGGVVISLGSDSLKVISTVVEGGWEDPPQGKA